MLDERILTVMLRIPPARFSCRIYAQLAYQDMPLPIRFEKTISQPFMCALMTDLLAPEPNETVLEVGTGWIPNSHFGRLAATSGPSRS